MDSENWLSETEAAAWRAYLTSTRLLMRALDRQLQRDSGIAHTHYAVLVQLSEQPDESARLTRLASSMDHSQSRMSHAVARMEEAGWVRRAVDPGDRRVVQVVLTDVGRSVLRTAAPGHVRCVRENLFDGLTPAQLAAFRSVCDSMLERLGAGGVEPVIDGTAQEVRGTWTG